MLSICFACFFVSSFSAGTKKNEDGMHECGDGMQREQYHEKSDQLQLHQLE